MAKITIITRKPVYKECKSYIEGDKCLMGNNDCFNCTDKNIHNEVSYDVSTSSSGNECYRMGIQGNCGVDCPIFLHNDCGYVDYEADLGELMSNNVNPRHDIVKDFSFNLSEKDVCICCLKEFKIYERLENLEVYMDDMEENYRVCDDCRHIVEVYLIPTFTIGDLKEKLEAKYKTIYDMYEWDKFYIDGMYMAYENIKDYAIQGFDDKWDSIQLILKKDIKINNNSVFLNAKDKYVQYGDDWYKPNRMKPKSQRVLREIFLHRGIHYY